jgi:hypothetical protein
MNVCKPSANRIVAYRYKNKWFGVAKLTGDDLRVPDRHFDVRTGALVSQCHRRDDCGQFFVIESETPTLTFGSVVCKTPGAAGRILGRRPRHALNAMRQPLTLTLCGFDSSVFGNLTVKTPS